MNSLRRQGGVVLLQVLVVFAVIAVILARFQYVHRVQLERTIEMMNQDQLHYWVLSGEQLAIAAMKLDTQESSIDFLDEAWAQQIGPFDLEGGQTISLITDKNRLFNLNWLAIESPHREWAIGAFERLLSQNSLSPIWSEQIVAWLDPDSGAEYDYQYEDPGYLPSFSYFTSTEALKLLVDVPEDELDSLKSLVSAYDMNSKLNVNTASLEVLKSLHDIGSGTWADDLVNKREVAPFENIAEIWEYSDFDEVREELFDIPVALHSDHFRVETLVEYNDERLGLFSDIQRFGDRIAVSGRTKALKSTLVFESADIEIVEQ